MSPRNGTLTIRNSYALDLALEISHQPKARGMMDNEKIDFDEMMKHDEEKSYHNGTIASTDMMLTLK